MARVFFAMPISRLVTAARRLPAFILFAAIAGAPLPFGSRDAATVAFWCGLLGLGVAFAPLSRLRRQHYWLLAGIGVIIVGYGVVLHEQLSPAPWIASFHPIWKQAAELLDIPVQPSVSIVRYEPFFALGAPLANILALTLGLLVGTNADDARRALRIMAWAGVGYAAYGIYGLLLDPTSILWREKTAYVGNLTATFINRNTAATYFGSCAVVWLLILCDTLAKRLPRGLDGRRLFNELTSREFAGRRDVYLPFAMLFVCLCALFLTISRAGTVFALFVLALGFVLRFRQRLPQGKGLLLAGLAIAGTILLLLQVMGGSVGARFETQGLSDAGRIAAWRSTLRIIADYPWFGTGLGTFAWAFPAYRSSEISMWGVWTAAHSTPLELASEVGVPLAGLVGLGWLVMLGLLARGALVRRHDRIVPLAAFCIGLLAILHSSLDFSLQVAGFAIVAFAMLGVGLAQAFSTDVSGSGAVAGRGNSVHGRWT
ncbi:O-antigen ligase family protein [Xanthobacteraceae bacterium Astr-EGSB]|uniref:O-antigen ligase family protein n=1 Tax=Astrobacterium formosum TaxID=3069710 RepID=UPI0027AE4282|nr:O-antigen ligase family protein [Xanthobacteraceae bacterium Astr-EGSB]